MNILRPINEKFNESYNQKGLQPSVGSVTPIRNIRVEKRNNVSEPKESTKRKNGSIGPAAKILGKNMRERANAEKLSLAKKALVFGKEKERETRVNISILDWATPLYIFVQLPFAVAGVLIMTVANTFFEYNSTDADSSFSKVMTEAGMLLLKALGKILSAVGFDFAKMSQDIFMMFMGVVFTIGLISLMATFLIYTLNSIQSLSGDRSGLKMGLFLLAIIGYFVPLANLFPWILFWMFAVWKYPK